MANENNDNEISVENVLREQARIQAEEAKKIKETPFNKLREKILNSPMPPYARNKIDEILDRLETGIQTDYNFERAVEYTDWLMKYPWNITRPINKTIKEIEIQLKSTFYGRNEIIEEILNYVSLYKLNQESPHGLKLCFVGSPGTGKTYIAKKIAESLNFDFTVASMGGAADASWLKGIPRHYSGSQPGRIIRGMCETQHSNCIFILDEIDKIGENHSHGSPSDALLEVIDPDNNESFEDQYLEIAVDLSKVIFIGIANNIQFVNSVLLDRFQIIYFNDYSFEDKVQISKAFLWNELLAKYHMDKKIVSITDAAIRKIIKKYEIYSGIREVKRALERVFTKLARKIVDHKETQTGNKAYKIRLTAKNINDYL